MQKQYFGAPDLVAGWGPWLSMATVREFDLALLEKVLIEGDSAKKI